MQLDLFNGRDRDFSFFLIMLNFRIVVFILFCSSLSILFIFPNPGLLIFDFYGVLSFFLSIVLFLLIYDLETPFN